MDWEVALATFGLVVVAELGDKTQLAVLAQTCKYRRPWAVFWGASLALTAVTMLGAVGGELVGRLVPVGVLRIVAALAFVVMGVLGTREAIRGGQWDSSCPSPAGECEASRRRGLAVDWRPFATTLGLLFVAEMGDKTQLAVLSMAGGSARPGRVRRWGTGVDCGDGASGGGWGGVMPPRSEAGAAVGFCRGFCGDGGVDGAWVCVNGPGL